MEGEHRWDGGLGDQDVPTQSGLCALSPESDNHPRLPGVRGASVEVHVFSKNLLDFGILSQLI